MKEAIELHKNEAARQEGLTKEAEAMVQVYKNKLEVSERIRESIGVGQMGPQGDSAELEQLKAKIAQVDAKLV